MVTGKWFNIIVDNIILDFINIDNLDLHISKKTVHMGPHPLLQAQHEERVGLKKNCKQESSSSQNQYRGN